MFKSHNNLIPKIFGAVLFVLSAVGLAYFLQQSRYGKDGLGGSSSASQSTDNNDQTPEAKNQTLAETVEYNVPGTTNAITVSLTLDNDGKITDYSTTHQAAGGLSKAYAKDFDAELNGKVVGKSASGFSLPTLGAASLTTRAFVEAVTKISERA